MQAYGDISVRQHLSHLEPHNYLPISFPSYAPRVMSHRLSALSNTRRPRSSNWYKGSASVVGCPCRIRRCMLLFGHVPRHGWTLWPNNLKLHREPAEEANPDAALGISWFVAVQTLPGISRGLVKSDKDTAEKVTGTSVLTLRLCNRNRNTSLLCGEVQ